MRAVVRLLAAAVAAVASVASAGAQDYPTRPVTLVVPWAAGGAVDTLARIVQPKLAERLGYEV